MRQGRGGVGIPDIVVAVVVVGIAHAVNAAVVAEGLSFRQGVVNVGLSCDWA